MGREKQHDVRPMPRERKLSEPFDIENSISLTVAAPQRIF
jgi:hypothetical protein